MARPKIGRPGFIPAQFTFLLISLSSFFHAAAGIYEMASKSSRRRGINRRCTQELSALKMVQAVFPSGTANPIAGLFLKVLCAAWQLKTLASM
jgi:hypothetical protein